MIEIVKSVVNNTKETKEIFVNENNLSSSEANVTVLVVALFIQILSITFNLIRKRIYNDQDNLDVAFDAGGKVSMGLTVTNIVATWTWSATLLESSTVTAKYGVSGAFWYSAGASVQLLLFSILAVQLKIRAPGAKTYLQLIRCRFGKATHLVFCVYALMTNIIVLAMLLLGGTRAILTVVDGYTVEFVSIAFSFIIALNCLTGGLGATFYASYFQSCGILIVVLIFVCKIFLNSEDTVGTLSSMFDTLNCVKPLNISKTNDILNMGSVEGFMFGVINLVGNFGAVFVDQVYWQNAIAAKPKQAVLGFLTGGVVWFVVPHCFATTMGLGYLAFSVKRKSNILNKYQIDNGLTAVAVASISLGKMGNFLVLVIILLAVVSTGASEIMAIGSILLARKQVKIGMKPPYQCNMHSRYRDYTESVGRVKSSLIIGTSVCIVPMTLILFALDITMERLYMFMGITISSAVIPIILCLWWTSLTKEAMVISSVGGTFVGILSWIIASLTYENGLENFLQNAGLGKEYPIVIGNILAFATSGSLLVIVTYFTNKNTEQTEKEIWEETKDIDNPIYPWTDLYRKQLQLTFSSRIHQRPLAAHIEKMFSTEKRIAIIGSVTVTFLLLFICPISVMMIGDFSRSFFIFWITLSVIAAVLAALYIVIVPVVDETLSVLKTYKRKRIQQN